MSKIRVHELAKELNTNNKEIMNYLKEKKIEVKSHMSTIEDAVANDIRTKFGNTKNEGMNSNKMNINKENDVKEKNGAKPEEHKKKASISAVYNPQYGKNPATRNGQRKTMSGTGEKPQPERRPRPAAPQQERRAQAEGRPQTEGRVQAEGRQQQGEKKVNANTERRPFNKEGQQSRQNNVERRNFNNNDKPRFSKDGNTEHRPFNNGGERRNNGGKNNRLEGGINRMNRNSDVGAEEKPKERENKRFKSKPQRNTYSSQK